MKKVKMSFSRKYYGPFVFKSGDWHYQNYIIYDMDYVYKYTTNSKWIINVDKMEVLEERLLACYSIVKLGLTIRTASKKHSIPHSTLHWFIHNKLRYISVDFYNSVVKQLEINEKKFRGNIKSNKP